MAKAGYAYILTNGRNSTLYIGITNNLARRIDEHRSHVVEGFSKSMDLASSYGMSCLIQLKKPLPVRNSLRNGIELGDWR